MKRLNILHNFFAKVFTLTNINIEIGEKNFNKKQDCHVLIIMVSVKVK